MVAARSSQLAARSSQLAARIFSESGEEKKTVLRTPTLMSQITNLFQSRSIIALKLGHGAVLLRLIVLRLIVI
jgi:hypothetical protein